MSICSPMNRITLPSFYKNQTNSTKSEFNNVHKLKVKFYTDIYETHNFKKNLIHGQILKLRGPFSCT